MFIKDDNIDELLVIFLELFTIRYCKYYSSSVITEARKIIFENIPKNASYESFKRLLICSVSCCDCNVYCFVSNFVKYLDKFDKYFKL